MTTFSLAEGGFRFRAKAGIRGVAGHRDDHRVHTGRFFHQIAVRAVHDAFLFLVMDCHAHDDHTRLCAVGCTR